MRNLSVNRDKKSTRHSNVETRVNENLLSVQAEVARYVQENEFAKKA